MLRTTTRSMLIAAVVTVATAVPATSSSAQPLDYTPGPVTHNGGARFVPAPSNDSGDHAQATPGGSAESGFQWGDAGIGAGAVLVLMGAGTAAVSGTRRRGSRLPA
jgi:hypothetical protein